MSEVDSGYGRERAWTELSLTRYDELWDRFKDTFGDFRAGVDPADWPAIVDPKPSVTFDLSVFSNGAEFATAYDAINAEALRAFVWALPDAPELVVLDWQHPCYLFRPAVQALRPETTWEVPVYPDGDYYAFLTPDYAHGTFGHPWEQTLCVIGQPLVESLGRSLRTWLPIKRADLD